MKKVFIGIGLVAILIIGGGVYLFSNLGSLIKSAIEEYGSQAAGVPVTVGGVDIELDQGIATITSLSLGTPPGFDAPHTVAIDRISVTLAPGWEKGEQVTIDEILINQPKITYELGSEGSNFDVLEANLKKTAGSKTGSQAQSKQDSQTAPPIIINNLRIEKGEVNATATLLGGKTLTLPLPDVHLTDLGKDKGGITPNEVAHKILQAIENSVSKAVTRIDLGVAKDAVKAVGEKIDAIKDGITDKVEDGIKDKIRDGIKDDMGKNLDDAGDAVKSLFGN